VIANLGKMAAELEKKMSEMSVNQMDILILHEKYSMGYRAMQLANPDMKWAQIPICELGRGRGNRRKPKEISIKITEYNPTESRVANQNEVVITDTEIKIGFDYPLGVPTTLEFKSPSGFTRGALICLIVSSYKQIYAEEEKTVKAFPVLPVGQRGDMLNRNTTDGKYRIWGHDITDLWLESINYCSKTRTVLLGIGS
jgi:hypothetical protein